MTRKVFLSILGTGQYKSCRYEKDGFVSNETKFIQQALLEFLQQKCNWASSDQVIVFLTDRAQTTHWIPNGTTDKGLKQILDEMGVSYKGVRIEDGKDTGQMWSIFETIFSQLQEEDELYIDITHSFRYLPMLMVVLVNYAKLLKKVTVAGIYYGNYEAKAPESDIAPVMDLLPLSSLQDWTSAASDYLQYGHIGKLKELTDASLIPILRDPATRNKDTETLKSFIGTLKNVTDERVTCRGLNIIGNERMRILNGKVSTIEEVTITQLRPVFEKIKQSMADFGYQSDVSNCIKVARWCQDNQLYQQAITMLEEGLISLFCASCKVCELDYNERADRDIVNKCVHIASRNLPECEWKEEDAGTIDKIRRIINDSASHLDIYANILSQVGELRNDYNHAGFNSKPAQADDIIKKIEKYLSSVENLLKR